MRAFAAVLFLLWTVAPVAAAEVIPGPVPATFVRAYDGDTPTVDAQPWPALRIRVGVRLPNVNAPEIRGACASEKRLARKARDWVRQYLGNAETIALHDIKTGKYADRVVARVVVDGEDLGDLLLARGLARPYDGGSRESWCN
jgi:endonuclease YncB( thermonuclease family)